VTLTSDFDLFLFVLFQQLLQRVVVLIEPCIPNGNDEVKESLKTSPRARRIVLNLPNREKLNVDDVDKFEVS
jgi:hypothetical protein